MIENNFADHAVGDTVTHDRSRTSARIWTLADSSEYRIVEIRHNSSGSTVRLDRVTGPSFNYPNTWYSTKHLRITKRGDNKAPANKNSVPTFIVMNEDGTIVHRVYTDIFPAVAIDLIEASNKKAMNEVQDKVSELLRKQPEKKFHVFNFARTGSLPVLPVQWTK